MALREASRQVCYMLCERARTTTSTIIIPHQLAAGLQCWSGRPGSGRPGQETGIAASYVASNAWLQRRFGASSAEAQQSKAESEDAASEAPPKKKEVSEVKWLMKFASQSAHSIGFHHSPGQNGYLFSMPPTSLIGSNSLPQSAAVMARMGFKKALVITDKFLSARGGVGPVISVLSRSYIDYHIFDGISPNPTFEEVYTGLDVLNNEGCDVIVSFGGGSPHDAAKAISLLKTNGGSLRDYAGIDLASKPGFPLVAVGTSGTGSELTRFACITDEERMTKSIIIDSMMTPLLTVEDPAVLRTPRHLTAATGMDCLTHAIEAYLSTNSNPVTDANALHSIKLASTFLEQSHATANCVDLAEQKLNSRARDMMGYASYLAAIAFNNAGLGLVHAMAHQVGGLYNLPHGVCCGLLLPTVLKFNAESSPNQIMDIATAMHLQGFKGPDEALQLIVSFLLDLMRDIGLPRNLEELGVEHKDIEFMAQNALQDSCIVTNPRKATVEQVQELYAEACAQDFEWR